MADYFVDNVGGSAGGTGATGDPVDTIAAALALADTDNDRVIVREGSGSYDVGGFLTLGGNEADVTILADVADTVITHNGASKNIGVLYVPAGTDINNLIEFDGFDIQPAASQTYGSSDRLFRMSGSLGVRFANCTFDLTADPLWNMWNPLDFNVGGSPTGNRSLYFDTCTLKNLNGLVKFSGGDGSSLSMIDCAVESQLNNGSLIAAFMEAAGAFSLIELSGNSFLVSGSTSPAVRYILESRNAAGSLQLQGCSAARVLRNNFTFESCGTVGADVSGGVSLKDDASNVEIAFNTFIRTEDTSTSDSVGQFIEVGQDEPFDSHAAVINGVLIHDNVMVDNGSANNGHGIVVGRGTSLGVRQVYGNKILGCNLGVNIEGTSGIEVRNNRISCQRSILLKDSAENYVHHNSVHSIAFASSDGSIEWDQSSSPDPDDPAPNLNTIVANIFSQDDTSPADYALSGPDGSAYTVSNFNVYVAGGAALANIDGDHDDLDELQDYWATENLASNDQGSIVLEADPFTDAPAGDFTLTEAAQNAIDEAGLANVGAGALSISVSSIAMTEGGADATYQIALLDQPTGDVTVVVRADGEIYPEIREFVFTPVNWDVPQTVTIKLWDDTHMKPSPRTTTITHDVLGPDAFNYVAAGSPIDVTITEDDEAGIPVRIKIGIASSQPTGIDHIVYIEGENYYSREKITIAAEQEIVAGEVLELSAGRYQALSDPANASVVALQAATTGIGETAEIWVVARFATVIKDELEVGGNDLDDTAAALNAVGIRCL